MNNNPLIIYNLFPKLAGNFNRWEKHILRAKKMGFTAIYINPIQYPGFSGSCYSIKDYFRIHEDLYLNRNIPDSAEDQFRTIVQFIHQNKMLIFMDLVINHTAVDNPLTREHPQWYLRDETGKIKNPVARDGDKIVAVWGDLAEIDNYHSPDQKNLWDYWLKVMTAYLSFGVDGFRCDAAYQVPVNLWKYLIGKAKSINPEILFLAETLGCPFKDVIALGNAGFKFTFNSSKYWDFNEEWCLKQYQQNVGISKSISFAESHDTNRLAQEVSGNVASLKQRYLFASVFSASSMMPIGFEFGFRKKLDVVQTDESDWELTQIDLTDFIYKANQLKYDYRLFREESPVEELFSPNDQILLLLKSWDQSKEKALIILNKDIFNHQPIHIDNLKSVFKTIHELKDISIEYRLDYIPNQFEYILRPGQIIIMYGNNNQ